MFTWNGFQQYRFEIQQYMFKYETVFRDRAPPVSNLPIPNSNKPVVQKNNHLIAQQRNHKPMHPTPFESNENE
jgi:hypothetical protein